jgi:ribosomal-protein-alanine N-acetyltransferase
MGGRGQRAVIERMAPRDLDAVVAIEEACFRAPWAPAVFIEELMGEEKHLDVLRAGGVVRGFINFWLVHDEVHVLNVAVHPEARRRGYASRLLQHALDFAWGAGCACVTLEVRRSNLGALRLYRRFGFRPVGIRPHYYEEDREDAVVMILERDAAPTAG